MLKQLAGKLPALAKNLFLAALFLFLFMMLAPGLAYRAREALESFQPAKAPEAYAPRVNMLTAPYLISWRAEEKRTADAPPAAALQLRIRPDDAVGHYERDDYWYPGRKVLQEADGSRAPYQTQAILLPDAETFPQDPARPFCKPARDENAFSGCQGSRAVLWIYKDMREGPYHLLTGKAGLEEAGLGSLGIRARDMSRFSFFSESQGKSSYFSGWDCKSLPEKRLPDRFILGNYSRCQTEQSRFLQLLPLISHREKHDAVEVCSSSKKCTVFFLFHEHLARLDISYFPLGDPDMEKKKLLVAAWQRLERQRADAGMKTEPVAAELAEMQAQTATCTAFATEFGYWENAFPDRLSDSEQNDASACRKAAFIATYLANIAPKEAEAGLRKLIPVLQALGENNRSLANALYPVLIAVSKNNHPAPSLQVLVDTTDYIRHSSGSVASISLDELRQGDIAINNSNHLSQKGEEWAFWQDAWELVMALKGKAPADQEQTVFSGRALQLDNAGDKLALVKLHEQRVALARIRLGEKSPALTDPLLRLAFKQWQNQRFDELKPTLDELYTLWMPQPALVLTAPEDKDIPEKMLMKDAGFMLSVLYGAYGRSQNRMAEVQTRQLAVMARLNELYGDKDPWYRAALCEEEMTKQPGNDTHRLGCGIIGYQVGPYFIWGAQYMGAD